MTTRADRRDELEARCAYMLDLQSDDPALWDEVDRDTLQSAIGMTITNHDETITMMVEVTTDEDGFGVITASLIDFDGNPLTPSILDLGTSMMIIGRPT